MVFEMGCKWLYSCCFVGVASKICLKQHVAFLCCFLSNFFSMRFVRVHVVHLYSSAGTTTAWKKSRLILSGWSNSPRIRSTYVDISVDEIFLPRYMNESTNFRCLPLNVEMALPCFKRIKSVLFAFTLRRIPLAAFSGLCSLDSAWAGVFARSDGFGFFFLMAYQPL